MIANRSKEQTQNENHWSLSCQGTGSGNCTSYIKVIFCNIDQQFLNHGLEEIEKPIANLIRLDTILNIIDYLTS